MKSRIEFPFARLVYESEFIREEIYLFDDLTHIKAVFKTNSLRINGGYFTYLRKLIRRYIKEHNYKDYERSINYIYNYDAVFNFENKDGKWVQNVYKYDLKQAYYNYFCKLFNDRLIQRYFEKLVDYMYNSVKKRHDLMTKKELRRIAIGMLLKGSKTYNYEVFDKKKNDWVLKDYVEIKNKTALWNKIQYDVVKALADVANKYIGKENWYVIWVDCIITASTIDEKTLQKMNEELKEKIGTYIRLKGTTEIVDSDFKSRYIKINNNLVEKINFNYFSKHYIIDIIKKTEQSYDEISNENILKPRVENAITVSYEDIKRHEAIVYTNELDIYLDIYELFETGNVRYLTKEDLEFIEKAKNSQVINKHKIENGIKNEDEDLSYKNGVEVLLEKKQEENKEDYETIRMKKRLAQKLEKMLTLYQGHSKWFEYKRIGEKIDFNEIYRYSIDDIKRIIEIYNGLLEAKRCGYKNMQRVW